MGGGKIGGIIRREYYDAIRDLLDEGGVVGCKRIDYLHFALAVRRVALRELRKRGAKEVWRLVDGVVAYYSTVYELDRELCYKIADRVISRVKQEAG